MTLEENIRSSGQDMSEVQLRRINMFYGKSTTKSTLMQTCLERAQDAGKSVIVVPRNVAMRPVDGLVELKFEQTTSPVEMASGEAFAVMITTLVGTKQGSSDKVNFQWGNLTVRLMDGNQVEAAATIEQIKQYNEGKTSVKLWKKSDGKWIVASLEAPLRQIGPKVQVAAPNKVIISAGMAAGMLIQKTAPLYPPIAKAARVQGTLVLQVDISKTGSIENLRVISGPAMLQQAALDAVKTWRYRPYLVNNQPVEVETTVNVIFTLGG
jgi:TonB family protein